MSQPFASLNDWGGSNISYTITETVNAQEGAIITCPIPTFNRAHDLGPFTGNGISITHDLSDLIGNVELGNITVALANVVSSPNVSIQETSDMVYRIGNVKTPEDYLAAAGVIDLPTDIGNVTFQFTSTVLNQTSNASMVINTTVNIDDQPEWIIPNPPYPTGNLQQSLWPLVYEANTTQAFDSTYQVAYVGDLENPDAGPYTVTIDTEDYPGRFLLSSTSSNDNIGNLWFQPGTDLGRLTITGSRSNINTYLANLQVTTNSGFVANAHPTYRTLGARLSVASYTPTYNEVISEGGGNISTASPYGTDRHSYYFNQNGPEQNLGTTTATNIRAGTLEGNLIDGSEANWWTLGWYVLGNGSNWTHEFWFNPDSIYNTFIYVGAGLSIAIYDSKIWACIGDGYPMEYGQPNNVSSYPTRIINSTVLEASQWYHLAIVRENGKLSVFVNGGGTNTYYSSGNNITTRDATVNWTVNRPDPFGTPLIPVWGGKSFTATKNNNVIYRVASFKGYIADIRISDIARYTGAFTPPTASFFNDRNTWFLANFRNNVSDDAVLPDLGTDIRTMTWTLTNPSGLVSKLYQPYTEPRDSSVSYGNVTVDRFGGFQSQHTQFLAQGVEPYVLVTAPYTIDGIQDDLIAVGNTFTSTITVTEHPVANNTTSYDLVRYNVRDARVALPGVGDIIDTVNYQFPTTWEEFEISGNIRTQGNTLIAFTPTTGSNYGIYPYDTFQADSSTEPQNAVVSVGIPPIYRDNRVAWRWLSKGSEYSTINGFSVRVESIQLYQNAGGWTRTGGFYGDWSSIRNYASGGEFNFGVRGYAVGIATLPTQATTTWRFSPLTDRPGLDAWYPISWVQESSNFGLYRGGPYTVGSQGYYTADPVEYASSSNKPFQIDVATLAMANTLTTKYATVTVTVAQPTLTDTIPIPGGGFDSPVSYTKTFNLLYGNFLS